MGANKSKSGGDDYVPPVPAKPAAKAKPAAQAKTEPSAAGAEWDPSRARAVASQSTANPVKTALEKSGVTAAMIAARRHFQQQTQQALAGPMAFAAGASEQMGPQNILATSFGQKWTDGRPTGKRGVLVLVRSKVESNLVQSQALVPSSESVKGEKVVFDVTEVGDILPMGFQTSEAPAPFGSSVGLASGPTGTLGCRVLWLDGNGKKCILSNNHVLADVNEAPIGSEIVQPGRADSQGGRRVGELVKYVPLNLSNSQFLQSAPNRVDAALAWTSAVHTAPRFHNDFPFDPEPVDFYEGMRVIKEGRTTGYTEGTINGIDADLNLPYRTDQFRNPAPPYAYFTGQIQIRADNFQPFSRGGDSGSLVCGLADDGAYHPIGLLFAGNGSTFTWANPIREVFDALDIDYIQYDPE